MDWRWRVECATWFRYQRSLVLTMDESDQMVRRALDAGARGYILKSDLTECLPKAVKAVSEGQRFLTPKVSEIVLGGFLGAREQHQQGTQASRESTPRESWKSSPSWPKEIE